MSYPAACEDTHATMNTWRMEKPVVGLMGEFSSGKSTLLNFLLAQDVATTKVTATPLPPIWFTYSETPYSVGLLPDGSVEDVDMADPQVDFRGTYLAIRRGVESAALKRCDIIDAPGISDPDLGKNALRFLQPYFDFVIWCTGASQAWRQTDKAAFEKLAKSTRDNSILVITKIDKLRSPKDRAKVLKRVSAETGALFASIVALQTTKAAAVPSSDRVDTTESPWVVTGGFDFTTALDSALSAIQPRAKTAPKAQIDKSAKKLAKSATKPTTTTAEKTDTATMLIQSLEAIKIMPENDRHCHQIDHLIASIHCEKSEQKRRAPLPTACSQVEFDELDIERLLSQIGRELHAFKDGDSIRLDT